MQPIDPVDYNDYDGDARWQVYKWLPVLDAKIEYRKTFNIKRTKFQNFNVSRLGLQLPSHNILKPSV